MMNVKPLHSGSAGSCGAGDGTAHELGAAHFWKSVADHRHLDLPGGPTRRPTRRPTSPSSTSTRRSGARRWSWIPGEVKSNNATLVQKFGPNNIADFGELELSQRKLPGPGAQQSRQPASGDYSLAYNLGDADKARKTMGVGKLKTTKWIVKFDILKAEEIAENKQGFDGRRADGRCCSGAIAARAPSRAGAVAAVRQGQYPNPGRDPGLVDRHALQDHGCDTTEQVAQGIPGGEDGDRRDADQRDGRLAGARKAALVSTPWSSGWCRRRSGKSTASTNNEARSSALNCRYFPSRISFLCASRRAPRRAKAAAEVQGERIPPLKLGKYEIRRELGRGAMGVVYEVFDPSIERVVALKTIRRDQLESAGKRRDLIEERFQREAKAAGRLNHPNIVSIYEFGEDGGTLFIAMEFVSGRELKSYSRRTSASRSPRLCA